MQTILDGDFQRYSTMGACVAVIQNGEVSAVFCYGRRNRAGEPVTPESVFQVGSISKMVTCMGLMRLVEQGKAELDGDLSRTLGVSLRNPEYPDAPITLRQLMTHTAGLRDSQDYIDAVGGYVRPLSRLFEGKRAARQFHDGVEPGTRSLYSNFGGGLLGAVLEALTGKTVDQAMSELIFQPLGVAAAYQPGLLPKDAPLCNLYRMPKKRLAKELRHDEPAATEADVQTHYVYTAGSLAISAPDLARLLIVLCDEGAYQSEQLLQSASVMEMRTRQNYRGSVFCASDRGLCMNILRDLQVEGRVLYGHGGKAYGMLCAAYFDPEDRSGVVMLTNGCLNERMRQGVGMLGRRVLTDVYRMLEKLGHRREELYQVAEEP